VTVGKATAGIFPLFLGIQLQKFNELHITFFMRLAMTTKNVIALLLSP